MSSKIKEQEVPKWFEGTIYNKGEVVINKFSGSEYELNNIELSIYDFIMGTQYLMETVPKAVTSRQVTKFHKALSWFRKNNPEAYMTLLD